MKVQKTLQNESCLSVFSTKDMIGTFSPQQEPYTHEMPEETAPSGFMARGSYTAKSKVCSTKFYICIYISSVISTYEIAFYQFLDDDNKCHLEINYTFDIRKDWASAD